jgi:phage-related protein
MSDFPPALLVGKEDSADHAIEVEDPAVRSETDGGYVYTRARHTRAPRESFTTGFTNITQAQWVALRDFYKSKFGGTESFTWTSPTDGVERIVRFKGPLKPRYSGAGTNYRWDVPNIVLEEV